MFSEDLDLKTASECVEALIEGTKDKTLSWNKIPNYEVKSTYDGVIPTGKIKEAYKCDFKKVDFFVGSYVRTNFVDEDIEFDSQHYYLSILSEDGTLLTYEDDQLNNELIKYDNEIYRLMRLIKVNIINRRFSIDDLRNRKKT
ncbi:hypothetical protein P8891_11325 [Bacillus atrophaeus]|uniref:hypothetical protein n=1 Tax=Bacillus atrophaeus TaxID=1452 RepID=UPI00227EE589|nr:hypothetical protein [Bacillus atrophaeus]MCY7947373.1 hypothetical protein [Bacillus atrophaeus]MCY9167717.1 hypothetical protein [Bacillus atrophaeus]MEC0741653.1 hypothetical protein [Bacillus atrophaeus]MEC0745032.1 hypothetical protein [Bacillus atrophaeus]MEC0758023.1 hypothetical protein [Bacillus atrophaeus]